MSDAERRALTSALERLRDWPIQTKADLSQWYEAAQGMTAMLCASESFFDDDDFHFLMHWLSDVDIRLKDPVYAKIQDEGLREVMATLARGR